MDLAWRPIPRVTRWYRCAVTARYAQNDAKRRRHELSWMGLAEGVALCTGLSSVRRSAAQYAHNDARRRRPELSGTGLAEGVAPPCTGLGSARRSTPRADLAGV